MMPAKILSWNVNGLRACIKKGFWDWFDAQDADVVCLQETKITPKDLAPIMQKEGILPLDDCAQELFSDDELKQPHGEYYYAHAAAEKAGYSGVLLISKEKPKSVTVGLGIDEYDREGRTVIAEFKSFYLVSTYVPNGGRELERIPYKLAYSDALLERLNELGKKKSVFVCGDMNVAHEEIDIKNAKSNVNNSGFTPIEREWFSKFLDHGYHDVWRDLNPDQKDVYTWWSYRPGVRDRNIGWRIDYFVSNKKGKKLVNDAFVQMKQQGSDHCPIGVELSASLT